MCGHKSRHRDMFYCQKENPMSLSLLSPLSLYLKKRQKLTMSHNGSKVTSLCFRLKSMMMGCWSIGMLYITLHYVVKTAQRSLQCPHSFLEIITLWNHLPNMSEYKKVFLWSKLRNSPSSTVIYHPA